MNTFQDVRSIVFSKMRTESDTNFLKLFGLFDNIIENHSSMQKYVSLGNSDALIIYPLDSVKYRNNSNGNDITNPIDTTNFFQKLLNEKKQLTTQYLYPNMSEKTRYFFNTLHIVKHFSSTEQQMINDFWNTAKRCIVITLIYNSEYSVSELEQQITNYGNNDSNVSFQVYRSINMSDLVVIWKSDILSSILNQITKLTDVCNHIKTHSLCGIWYEESTIGNNIEECSDIVKMMTLSGTIRSQKALNKVINDNLITWPTSVYCDSFGNDDFTAFFDNVQVDQLINLLNSWQQADSCIRNAFYSLKIHMLTEYNIEHSNNEMPCNLDVDKLIKYSKTILEKCEAYSSSVAYSENEFDWVYPLIESLNMLSNMSKTPFFSRIIYFTADSIYTFCKAISECIKEHNNKTTAFEALFKSNKRIINRFATALHMLINRLVRVDGYLNQDPSYSLLVYNMIPAGILEFYYSFIYMVLGELKSAFDNGQDSHYSTLLFPELARRVKIDDVLALDPKNKSPIYPLNQIYLVEVPYKTLYRPRYLLLSVTHEIMHFCGETIRCRDSRYYTILGFVTEYLIYEYGFECEDNQTSNILFDYFQKELQLESKGRYLDVLIKELTFVILKFYQNNSIKNDLFETYKNYCETESTQEHIRKINETSREMKLLKLIKNIKLLFRECYADLLTLCILKVPVKEYFEAIFSEAVSCCDEPTYSFLVQRVALVLCVLQIDETQSPTQHELTLDEDMNPQFENAIIYINQLIANFKNAFIGEEMPYNLSHLKGFPVRCLLHVIEYLKQCFITYSNSDQSIKQQMTKISDIYNCCEKDEFIFGDDYTQLIESNRTRIRHFVKDGSKFQ